MSLKHADDEYRVFIEPFGGFKSSNVYILDG